MLLRVFTLLAKRPRICLASAMRFRHPKTCWQRALKAVVLCLGLGLSVRAAEAPVPDAARLLAVFLDWTRDPAQRRTILTDNPARLYGFPPL
mgnify:CR=1 FL=1